MRFGPDLGFVQGYLEKCLGSRPLKKSLVEKFGWGIRKTGYNSYRASCVASIIMRYPKLLGWLKEIMERCKSWP